MRAMKKSDAIQHFGGVTRLSKLLEVSRQAIYKWPEVVPDLYQYKLHHLSGGVLAIDGPLTQTVDPPRAAA